MSARLAQIVAVSLLAGTVAMQGADGEATVKVTGIAEFNSRRYALLEIVARPGGPITRPILAAGEHVAGVEVKEIDTQSGRVQMVVNGIETFYMVGSGEPAATGRTLRFKSASLAQVLEIYQMLSGRTVLRPSTLPGAMLDLQTGRLSNTEALQAIEQLLLTQGIVTRPRDDKFVFVVKTDQTNRLALVPEPPVSVSGGEVLPAGLIKFQDADLAQVLEIYQELTGRTILKPSNLPATKISVRSQTEMARDQVIWMLDALFALADIAILPHGEKFVVALAGIENPRVPAFEVNPVSTTVNAQEVLPAGMIKFTAADISQVLSVYAHLMGRKPVPVDRTTPDVKMTIQSQTSLTRAEAISALDAVAALNRIQFVLVEDDKVKVLPAALARRETNPAP